MKIIHMADSHLGFTSYNRVDKFGRNLFEERVYSGFEQAIDMILQLRPDAVVHSGDVFHHVRPKIKPLYVFKRGIERLSEAGIPLIIISGNHDAPKGYSATSPFIIFEGIREVNIARKYEYERFEIGDSVFHCIPFCLDPQDYISEFRKIKISGRDILVMHGLIESMGNKRLRTVGEHELKDSLLKKDFDYIALGHYHAQTQISENAWYSGSIEYFNFGEARDEKGMLLVDLEKREAKPVGVRQNYMIDNPPINCSGMSSVEIAEELFNLCDNGLMEDKIVRINLENLNRAAYRNISQSKLSKLASQALYLKIRVEYAEEQTRLNEPVDSLHLHEEFLRFLDEESKREAIPKSIKEEVIAYGTELIKKVMAQHNTEALNASE